MYKLNQNATSVIRLSDGYCIPLPANESEGWKYEQWLAEGNTPKPADLPTPEQIQATIVIATQARLDDFAKTRGYTNTDSISKYKDITDSEIAALPADEQFFVTKFRGECRYLAVAIASTWARLYLGLAEVQAGTRPMPTGFADVEPLLPVLVWPA